MAKLKKLYYSLTQNTFFNVLNLNNTSDIGSVYSAESLRLIPFGAPVETQNLLQLVKDLLYNDIQINLESSQLGFTLANGIFKNVGTEFSYQETINIPDLKKIKFLSGQIKIGQSVVYYDTEADNSVIKGNITSGSDIITNLYTVSFLKPGMSINHPNFPSGTTIRKILSSSSIKVSAVSNNTLTFQNLGFANDYSYEIMNLPVNCNTVSGSDIITDIYSVNDIYLGMNIISAVFPDNTKVIEIINASSVRVSNNALTSNINISIIFSSEIQNEGFFRRDSVQINTDGQIFFVLGNENSQITAEHTQQDALNSDCYVLYSMLIKKTAGITYIDSLTKLFKYTGLVSSVLSIKRGENDINYENTYEIENGDSIHLTDINGGLLNWESGQSDNVNISSLGAGYTENTEADEYLKFYDRTQLPQTFDDLNTYSLVNIPFKITNIQNIFGNSINVPVKKVLLGVKRDSADYGDEGIEIKISTAEPLFEVPENINSFISNASNATVTVNAYNFSSLINGYQITVNDFILVTSGDGRFQTGKIESFSGNTLIIKGLTKNLNASDPGRSSIQIFKNSTVSEVLNSDIFIDNSSLVSQILSGQNGRFGQGLEWARISLDYTVSPVIQQDKWYFLQVKGYNINPPTWGNLPYITIEKPYASLNDNKTRSAYFQINYSLIAGIYPNGDFLIEDEFGDIGETRSERLLEPHFRPDKYNLIANNLSDSNNYTLFQSILNPEDVFVDVKHGKVMFKKGYEPRRVYFTYNKINVLNGDSSANNLRFNRLNNSWSSNIQNKLIELDLRFKKGTDFNSVIKTDGIRTLEDINFYKGSFDIEKNKVILKDDYNFHNKSSENHLFKLNRGYTDEIVSISKNELFLNKELNLNSLQDEKITENFKYSERPMRPGVNYYDSQIWPKEENLRNKDTFYLKKFNEKLNYVQEFDSIILNPSFSGNYNNITFNIFKKETVINSILHKNLTSIFYDGDIYPADNRNFKTANIISREGKTEIISEKFFSDYKTEADSFELDKLAVIIPYIENTNYSEIELLKNIDSETVINFNTIDYDVDTYKDNIIFSYINLVSTQINHKYFKKMRNITEEKEISVINQIGTDYINPDTFQKIKVKTEFINDTMFTSLFSCLNAGNFEIYLSIYSYSDSGISIIKENILVSSEVYLDNFFDLIVINDNIAISWKQSITKTSFIFYSLKTSQFSSVNLFTNENIFRDLKMFKFSENIFGIITGASGSLKLRLFNSFGETVFLNGNSLYFEISSSNTPVTFDLSVIKLNSNNFAITYSEENASLIDTKITLITDLYSYSPITVNTKTVESGISVANRIESVGIVKLNEDLFALSYIKNNVPVYRIFQNNLSELKSNFTDSNTVPFNTRKDITVLNGFFNSFISVYKEQNNSIKLDSFELLPDFANLNRINSTSNISMNSSSYGKTVKSDSVLSCFEISNSEVNLTVFNILDKQNPVKYNAVPFQICSGLINSFDAFYSRKESGKEIIIAVYIKNGDLYSRTVNVISGTPVFLSPETLIKTGPGLTECLITQTDIYNFNVFYKDSVNSLKMKKLEIVNSLIIDFSNITVYSIESSVINYRIEKYRNLEYLIYTNSLNDAYLKAFENSNTGIILGSSQFITSNVNYIGKKSCEYINGSLISFKTVSNENKIILADLNSLLINISNSAVIIEELLYDTGISENSLYKINRTDSYLGLIYNKSGNIKIKIIKIENNMLSVKYNDISFLNTKTYFNIEFTDNNNFIIIAGAGSQSDLISVKMFKLNVNDLIVENSKVYHSVTVKCIILNYNNEILDILEVYRESFEGITDPEFKNLWLDYSVSVIKINSNTFGILWHDNRNRIKMRKFIIENRTILSVSAEINIGSVFPIWKNININAFNIKNNAEKAAVVFNNPVLNFPSYEYFKKIVIDFNGNIFTDELIDIEIPVINIKSIVWISGNLFDITVSEDSDITGFESGMKFDITNDTDIISFNSVNMGYTAVVFDKVLRKITFSHPVYTGAVYNKTGIGSLKVYNYDLRICCAKKYETDYIGIYMNDRKYKNHFISILNPDTAVNHIGKSFKLKDVDDFTKMSKANMDSSGLVFFAYKKDNDLFSIYRKQFGAEGNSLNSFQIIGKNELINLEIEQMPEKLNEIVNLRYLNSVIGKKQSILLEPNQEIILTDSSSMYELINEDNIYDKISFYYERNDADFKEIRVKLDTIFSVYNISNKIYVMTDQNKVKIINNFSSAKSIGIIRKE